MGKAVYACFRAIIKLVRDNNVLSVVFTVINADTYTAELYTSFISSIQASLTLNLNEKMNL